jgi:hypothetical protein
MSKPSCPACRGDFLGAYGISLSCDKHLIETYKKLKGASPNPIGAEILAAVEKEMKRRNLADNTQEQQ